jgi:anti-sigma B factor antagonist
MTSGPGDRGTRFAAIPDRKKSLTDRSVSVRLGFVGELNDQQQTFARRFHVSLKASTRQVTGVTIVDLSGNIKLGEGTSVLRETVKDLLGKGQKKMLLNLAEISYIDSSGIGELVSAFTSVRNQGGELKLLHLTKKVHDLLQITKLYTVFDVKDDEAAAISAFG